MKKIQKNFALIILTMILAVSLSATIVSAQDDPTFLAPLPGIGSGKYTVLAPLPGIGDSASDKTTTIAQYLPAVFKLSIGVAAVLAFAMITLGGITYATSDSIFGKSEGKKYLENAIWGLILVIASFAILNTINPQILNLRLSLPKPYIKSNASMTQDQIDESNRIGASLGQTRLNPCAEGQTIGCVSFNGMQPGTVTALQDLHNNCNGCTVDISGGTEGGHAPNSSHDNGTAVDIRPEEKLNAVIFSGQCRKQSGAACDQFAACNVYTYRGGNYLWEPEGSTCGGPVASSGNHWHASF